MSNNAFNNAFSSGPNDVAMSPSNAEGEEGEEGVASPANPSSAANSKRQRGAMSGGSVESVKEQSAMPTKSPRLARRGTARGAS